MWGCCGSGFWGLVLIPNQMEAAELENDKLCTDIACPGYQDNFFIIAIDMKVNSPQY